MRPAADLPEDVAALDATALAPLARAALGAPAVRVVGWRTERIGRGAPRATGGVFRLRGTGDVDGVERPWSLILKLVSSGAHGRWTAGDETNPRSLSYWPREPLAFASGLLADLPGIAAPACYRVEERPDGYRLWLQDVPEAGPARWPLARFATAARHLGLFNGAYAAGRPVPDHPWLSGGYVPWFRGLQASPRPVPAELEDPATWQQPAVRRLFPEPLADRARAVVAQRGPLIDALEALPTTFCHNDAFRRNLIGATDAGGNERTVAVDWEYVGLGPLGVEPALLTGASLQFGEFDPARRRELDQAVFEGYLDGLRAAGWRGDPAPVRLAYAALAVARWGVGGLWRAVDAATTRDPDNRARLEAWLEMPIDRVAEQFAGFGGFVLDMADEALGLLRRGSARR